MGEVTAVRQVETKDGVAWLEARQHDRRIRGSAGVRLNVRPFGTEELTKAVDRQLLDLVHKLTTSVIALAGQTLGIFVGQDAALGGHHRFTGVVL